MSKRSIKAIGLDGKDITLIILAVGILYILATHIIEAFISLFLFGIALLIAVYFILPRLGVAGITSLIGRR